MLHKLRIQVMNDGKLRVMRCGSDCVQVFTANRTQLQLRQLPLPNFYCAAARNSGPVALLYRKYNAKEIKLPQNYDSSIVIFNCRGEFVRCYKFQLKERVILFTFTQQQNLLILYATGQCFVLDIATGQLDEPRSLMEEEGKSKSRCLGAVLVGEQIVMLRDKTLGLVEGLDQKWRPLTSIRIHTDFALFDAASNANQELEIVFLNSNYEIQLYTFRPKERTGTCQLLYDHPELRALAPILISLSLRNGTLVLIFTEFALVLDCEQEKKKRQTLKLQPAASTILPNKTVTSTLKAAASTILPPQGPSSNPERGKIVVNANGSLSENSVQAIRKAFRDSLVSFQKFKIEREDWASKSSSGYKYRKFYVIGWLERVCYFSDFRKVIFLSVQQPRLQQVPVSESAFLLAPSDGLLRIIDEHTYVLRVINNPLYYTLADQPSAAQHSLSRLSQQRRALHLAFLDLLQIFQNYVERRPNSMQQVHGLEQSAEGVWEAVMEAVELAMDAGLQLKMLKVARWLQALFGVRGESRELLSRLRVVNGLKYEHLNRWLTYKEFESLRSEKFLLMLLKSNMHYVADLIFQDSDSKKAIFIHWAKCKIEKETPGNALDQIKQRYNDMRTDLDSKFVFSELALYALHRRDSLPDLALRLAENQTHPARKCVVYLLVFRTKRSLDLVDKLLDFAQDSLHNGVIHRTLHTLRSLKEEVPEQAWLELLPKKPYLQAFYLRVLKAENSQDELQRYYEVNKIYAELAYLGLNKSLKEAPEKSIESAVAIVQKDYAKLLPSLAEQLSRCQPRSGIAKLRALRDKETPISETDADEFTQDSEFQSLGELIAIKDKNLPLAVRIFKRMRSSKLYEILKVKGKMKDAMEVAFERKDKLKLAEILEELGEEDDNMPYGRQLLEELEHTR